jgi:flagellar basal-body rod modification protein FlgD
MVDSISALGTGASSATSGNSLGSLDSDVFLQLMVAQLRYQNPLEPTDATAMMAQTAQFTTVETLQAISDTQQQLMNMSQLSAGLDMVGKDVEAIGFDGRRTTGTVTGVRFSIDGVVLEMENGDVPLVNVISVTQPPMPPPADQGGGDA